MMVFWSSTGEHRLLAGYSPRMDAPFHKNQFLEASFWQPWIYQYICLYVILIIIPVISSPYFDDYVKYSP